MPVESFHWFIVFIGSEQCRSKGNISGGGGEGTLAPEAQAAKGVWGCAPPENFEI